MVPNCPPFLSKYMGSWTVFSCFGLPCSSLSLVSFSSTSLQSQIDLVHVSNIWLGFHHSSLGPFPILTFYCHESFSFFSESYLFIPNLHGPPCKPPNKQQKWELKIKIRSHSFCHRTGVQLVTCNGYTPSSAMFLQTHVHSCLIRHYLLSHLILLSLLN